MILIKTPIDLIDSDENHERLLLGDWCLKNQEDILGSKDYFNRVPYHWDDRDKYSLDYSYLDRLYEETLAQLADDLNKLHAINQDLRYWRIVLGPWLRFFVDALFDRYECVRAAKEVGTVTTFVLYSYNLDDWCPADFSEFWTHFTSDEWNEIIFSECLLDQGIAHTCKDESIIPLDLKVNEAFNFSNIIKSILKSAASLYSEVIRHYQTGVIVIGGYVPLRKLIKLQFRLRQLPYLVTPALALTFSEKKLMLRDKLCRGTFSSVGFEGFLAKSIRSLMPKVYLEDFLRLKGNVLNTYPDNPKSIFTANSYHLDDMFKIWAAEKVSDGVPLIIGQHGGTFGMASVNQSEEHQLKIADKWLSWGWDCTVRDNIVKFPSFQLSGRACIKPSKNGDILHVLSSMPRYFYQHFSMPVAGQFLLYIENQLNFLDRLEINYLDFVRIRLDSSNESRGWDIPKALDVAGYSKHVDRSNERIPSLLSRSRLCICTHNATVFLECLEMNFPTIIFWEPSHHEIRSDAVPFFDLLLEAGILFYTPEEAAKKVNTVAHNVDEWWFSDQVQSARKKFCERYARSSDDWEREWGKFLLGAKKIS